LFMRLDSNRAGQLPVVFLSRRQQSLSVLRYRPASFSFGCVLNCFSGTVLQKTTC